MANVLVEERSLQAIADAIRCKTGGTDTYKPREMAPAVRNLPGTGVLQNLSVTENGVYTPEVGVDGFDIVSVAVPGGFGAGDEGKVVQNGALMPQTSLSVTENGTYDTTDKSIITVNVSNTVILSGTQAPLNDQGDDGNLYFKHSIVDFLADSNYLVLSNSQLLATHSTQFYKTVDGPAIAVHWKDAEFYGPVLVSTVASYTYHTQNTTTKGSAIIDGITWYISGGEYWNRSSDAPSIPTLYDTAPVSKFWATTSA